MLSTFSWLFFWKIISGMVLLYYAVIYCWYFRKSKKGSKGSSVFKGVSFQEDPIMIVDPIEQIGSLIEKAQKEGCPPAELLYAIKRYVIAIPSSSISRGEVERLIQTKLAQAGQQLLQEHELNSLWKH